MVSCNQREAEAGTVIAERFLTQWQARVPWPTPQQVEQDLLISRMIIEIANDDLLGGELAFRGGTCLHKLHLPQPLRYSDDLDYVRTSQGPIGPVFDALREIGERLGMKVNVDNGVFPKVVFRTTSTDDQRPLRIKVEMNTYERFPALPLITLPYALDSM